MKIYFWQGLESNKFEKIKGLEIAVGIKNNERMAQAKLIYPRDVGGQDEEDFWQTLGGQRAKINAAIPDDSPSTASESDLCYYALFKVSNASGKLERTEISDRPLKRAMLDTNDSFILELYDQVYVWQGLKADLEEKKSAMKIAKDFITEKGKPKTTRISRLSEGVEDSLFKSYFEDFFKAVSTDFGDSSDQATHANQDVGALA